MIGHEPTWNCSDIVNNPPREPDFPKFLDLLEHLIYSFDTDQEGWPPIDSTYALMIDAVLKTGDFGRAAQLNEKGLKLFPDSTPLLQNEFFLFFTQLQPEQAVELGKKLSEESRGDENVVKFHTALAQLLTRKDDFEYRARNFIFRTDHPYRDYIRMMLYWALCAEGEEGETGKAKGLLSERWKTIYPGKWADRLKDGDTAVWREKLVGLYLGKVDIKEIFGPLENREAYERSQFGKMGLPYSEACSEAYFYDALLQGISGDPATRKERQLERLQKVLDKQCYPSYEYHMARYLVSRLQGN